jgi:serine/threonine protein kinase
VIEAAEEFGPYRVFEQLGIGGVATVHRAEIRTPEGRKVVALKRLLPHLMMTPGIVEAFTREAKLARHMHHHNIAETYETGKVNKVSFIAMELVPGPTLDQIMRHSQAVAGAIPIPVTLGILIQICDALDYAHNLQDGGGTPLGIIHRDVSPPNIILSNTGVLKLIDFGIAKVQNASNPRVTGQGVIKGKMNYVAPEYIGGRLDARADLFAVGVIAHELLTGRRLFEGADDFETTARVLQMPIQPPSRWSSQVSKDLDNIVLTALAREPAHRWQSAAALRTALAMTAATENAIADHAKIIQWVAWAFSQKTRPSDGQLHQVLSMLDGPSTSERVLSPEQQQILDEVSFAKTPMIALDRSQRPTSMKDTAGYAGIAAIRNLPPPKVIGAAPPPQAAPERDRALFDSQPNTTLYPSELLDGQANTSLYPPELLDALLPPPPGLGAETPAPRTTSPFDTRNASVHQASVYASSPRPSAVNPHVVETPPHHHQAPLHLPESPSTPPAPPAQGSQDPMRANLFESQRHAPLQRPPQPPPPHSVLDSQRHAPLQRPPEPSIHHASLMESQASAHRPDLVDSQRNAALQRNAGTADTQPPDAALFQSGSNKPMIVAAKPLQQKRGRKYGSLTPAAGEPPLEEDAPEESNARFWLYAFLVLLAGAGGVLAMSYLLGAGLL